MMSPALAKVLGGISGILGLIAVLGYAYFDISLQAARRSIAQVLEGEPFIRAAQVLKTLEGFHSDEARLEALATLTKHDLGKAALLMKKIKEIDVNALDTATSKSGRRLSVILGIVFLGTAALLLIPPAFRPPPPSPGPHTGQPSTTGLLDPPALSFGMTVSETRRLLGSRHPVVEHSSNGSTTLVAPGMLFGLQGTARYGFDANGKLSWMSVDNQCTERGYDFTRTAIPKDLDPSWLEWHPSPDHAMSYATTTSCANILNVPMTLRRRFGDPAKDARLPTKHSPSISWICHGLNRFPTVPCEDARSDQMDLVQEFIGPDRVTELGVEIRQLTMSATVQFGTIYPIEWRRELVGIVSVWGSGGPPKIEPRIYGNYHESLER